MKVAERLHAFSQLHGRLKGLDEDTLNYWKSLARSKNAWFRPEDTQMALEGLIAYLVPEQLAQWVERYQLSDSIVQKKVGVVMAGNIPLVGVHDFICVLMSGHSLHAKLSSQDPVLMKEVAKLLLEIEPRFADSLHFVERMNEVDALIATGSDNSARYFEYYFRDKPKIIRKNRTSVAVLTGKESPERLQKLADDVFTYFGLGCRNVSKVFVPQGYDFIPLLHALEEKGGEMSQNHKYNNNYDYNKSILLINGVSHLDNGSLLLTHSDQLVSPISVLYYSEYEDEAALSEHLNGLSDKIQCVVAESDQLPASVAFGEAQYPSLSDYADGVDTLEFLKSL